MSSSHFPRRGDKVNDKRRIPNANGFVYRVLYNDGPEEVMVQYADEIVTYDYEDFRNRWTDNYGGAFELVNPPGAITREQIEALLKALKL